MIVDDEDRVKYLHMASITSIKDPKLWILDSGASKHFCGNKGYFFNLKPILPIIIRMGNSAIEANQAEDVILTVFNGEISNTLLLHDVLFVPEISANLISVSK
jgi:hypothetical protein